MHTTVSIPEDQVLYQEMQPLRVMSDVTCKKSQMNTKKVLAFHWNRKVNKTSEEDTRLHFNDSLDFWVTLTSINN